MGDQAPPRGGLAAAGASGAITTFGGQLLRIAIQLTGVVVLARLLDPTDYGLIAMVTAIIGVGEVFRDFGLSSAAIQAASVSREQKSNLFWINTSIGLALALVVCAASGGIAALYDDERLVLVSLALSSTFLLNGIITQFRADLTRKLQFVRLTSAEVASQLLGLVIGIVLAALGAGYWALVAQQIAHHLIQLIILVVVTDWFPAGIYRRAEMKPFLGFGANIVGAQLLGYASRNVDSVVIGATLGAGPLGLYNRAFQLMLLPLNQLNAPSTRVALPILSRLQDDRDRFSAFILFGQSVMLNAVCFVFAFLGAQAYAIIAIALGDQWLASVPIFQILLVAGLFQTAGYATYWAFLAKGLTRSNLHYALLSRPLMVVIIVLGVFWGVNGVAAGYALGSFLLWPLGLWWIGRVSDVPVRAMFWNGMRALIAYSLATAASYASTYFLDPDALVLRLAVGFTALVAAVALIALIWPRFRRDLVAIAGARRYLRRERSGGAPNPEDSPE